MYTNDKTFLKLLEGETLFQSAEDHCTLRRQELGEVYLPTGKIIACDPCCLFEIEPFTREVTPGSYPVSVYIADYDGTDKRVAFAMITFNNEKPDSFELCLVDGQDVKDLGEDEFYGYGVDAGTGGFFDEETWHFIEEMNEDYQYEWLDDALGESYVDTYSTANVCLPDKANNIVAFSSGWGDGEYPSFWGMKAGKICCLITDFLIID